MKIVPLVTEESTLIVLRQLERPVQPMSSICEWSRGGDILDEDGDLVTEK